MSFILSFLLLLFTTHKHPMPTHVDVGGVDWNVKVVKDVGDGYSGYTNCKTHVITVSYSMPLHDQQDVLLHELLHANVCQGADHDWATNNLWYNSTTAEKHEGIYRVADFESTLLRSNPRLVAFLGRNN